MPKNVEERIIDQPYDAGLRRTVGGTGSGGSGVTDHGALTGLGDDDHSIYHNDARGDARYFRENEHINASAGVADAGKPIVLDAAGHVDASMINSADIGTALAGAAEQTTLEDTNKIALTDEGVLKWVSWSNIKATLTTLFNTLYMPAATRNTWTPAITGAISNPTVTYTQRSGKYTIIDNVLFYNFRLQINTISGGSGLIRISLPTTVSNDPEQGFNGPIRFSSVDLTGVPANVIFVPVANQVYGQIQTNVDNGAAQTESVPALANGAVIGASGFYFTE